jgi:hypothetical protein
MIVALHRRLDRQQPAKGGTPSARVPCIPWKPTFSDEGVTFGLGLLNQMVATNHGEELSLADDVERWVVLDVTTSNGAITGYAIALDNAPPGSDQIAADTPPATFKIVLGMIKNHAPCMVVEENLEALAVEQFRESRDPATTGEEPFKRWWRWKVQQNTQGDYPYTT